ncbi:MAG: GTP 3',8-cyclase MoaA [Dehalococcoidia bacterium]|jgi:cyclic pyranopterin phosphate synthase|nr:GTP 3',8-cyclase MoaA [Dehalococcoidia bacterium]
MSSQAGEFIPLTPVSLPRGQWRELAGEGLVDPIGRRIEYLRISVTDRCNLRCVYCMPEEGVPWLPREEVLTLEEIWRVVRVAASMGLRRVRLTGGEPTVRRGLVELVRWVASTPGIEDVALTTNGVALAAMAKELAEAGLRRINVSLDTLRADRFRAITRWGKIEDVLAGIEAARRAGLSPIKLNVVVMRGVNDDEVVDFARTTLDEDWEVRFIELMPFMDEESLCIKMQGETSFSFVPTWEVKRRIEEALGPLAPAQSACGAGPAKYWRLPGARGLVGFISPLTEHAFCATCNRMRLTADGKIRPCLLTDHEVDLKGILRGGGSDEELRGAILLALRTKPDAHHLWDGNRPRWRKMVQIGG